MQNVPKIPVQRSEMTAPSWNRFGGLTDLADPKPGEVDFPGIAAALSKLVRWAGRHDGPGFSVAQHCVMGADAMANETGDRIAAGAFLLHDAHEGAGIGDIVTPAVKALAAIAAQIHGPGAAQAIRDAVEALKWRHDVMICEAAGVDWKIMHPDYDGLSALWLEQHDAVKSMDRRMAEAEAHYLFGPRACPRPDPYPKFTGALKPWGPAKAEQAWLDRLDRYLGVRP